MTKITNSLYLKNVYKIYVTDINDTYFAYNTVISYCYQLLYALAALSSYLKTLSIVLEYRSP
jgi:hypothetical protein